MKQRCTIVLLAIAGDAPPAEFRIFASGKNETTKGCFTFDAESAAAVMSEYLTHGIDLMVDYDHASLSSCAPDPAQAGKAAAWFGLEVRNGELWAVNVRWTPPAAAALGRKEWRFTSPAFTHDDTGRITSLLNVAITNMPATRRLEPLVAASKGNGMDPSLVAKALDAIEKGDAKSALEILKGLLASAAGGDPDATTEDAPPPVGDGGADEGTEAAKDPAAPPPMDDPKKDKPEAVAASITRFVRLTGKTGLVDAVAEAEIWRASHIELASERQKLASERAILENEARRKLCVDLVKLAGRSPATVWADDKAQAPKAYLAAMPIDDFRAYVSDAIKACGGRRTEIKTPTTGPGAVDAHGLTPDQLSICKELNCDPATFARLSAKPNCEGAK